MTQRLRRDVEGSRPVTGRFVLICLLAFFATVVAVNVAMVKLALSTNGGVKTESAYKAGLAFQSELADVRRQDALHWAVAGSLQRDSGGIVSIVVDASSADGKAIVGLAATVILKHPFNARLDRSVPLTETAPGHFEGTCEAAAGQWDTVVDLARGGERVFRSQNRFELR
jgi:nitrogen fixation protein FixH